jgi:phospholipase D1/2
MTPQEQRFDSPSLDTGLLKAGRNCWRIERTHRFAMLVDAAAYFRAVRTAICNARHSVFILSWDIDSRTRLIPEGAEDGFPEPLGEFLHAVVSARPGLRICVLNWDYYTMLYGLEREWLPAYKFDWQTHQRLCFRMDSRHPLGAAHHQKLVAVDDTIAFVGGLDLTRCRWDTPQHAGSAPLRCDSDGTPYGPFHDVQVLVDGAAARALGELARTRWERAVSDVPSPPLVPVAAGHDPWPKGLAPDVRDVDVAISRTEPAVNGSAGVHEVRQLHLDAIAAARRYLFFENQYFTSGLIANAFAARLEEPHGPEVAIVMPQIQSGWLEQATLGLLRARVHRRLKAADRHQRYGMYFPFIPGLGDQCLNVHSKVFTVDDDVLSIGSANLSNRSMAIDTECNLSIEARGDPRVREAIAGMRSRLLAEHLDQTTEAVKSALVRHGSLHRTIAAFPQSGRTLRAMEPVAAPELDALIPEQALFDPERPIEPDQLLSQLVPREARKPLPRRLVGLGVLAFALALLAVAWRWTPLGEWVNLVSLVTFARGLEALPFTPIAVIFSYVAAGLLVVPVTLLIAVTGIVFGPFEGALYALGGTLLSAAVTYGLGHWLGRDVIHRLLGPRANRLSRRLARQGILAMVIIRMLPIAPFTIVNVVAGASHIRLRDYLLGTLFGMLPGIVITVTFVHHLAEAVRNPTIGTFAVLATVAAALIGLAISLQKLLRRKEDAAA